MKAENTTSQTSHSHVIARRFSLVLVLTLSAACVFLAGGSAAYAQTGDPVFSFAWTSIEADDTDSVAWGDYDGDGDLDLAVGNSGQPNRLYRNDGGSLTADAVWSSAEADYTSSIAWGDVDGDGDLDLAVGNGNYNAQPNRLYRNDGGTITTSAVWSSIETDDTRSVAWGDYDGDGDLDLAAGNYGQPNRLYRNNGGALSAGAVWSSTESDSTTSVAWADYDGDGDLDLAVGNLTKPTRLYRNSGGVLTSSAAWSSTETDGTLSVAWGDYDADGDLDLAVGNLCSSSIPNPNCRSVRLYRNNVGTLTSSAIWSSSEADYADSMAWGDYDGDGDVDLAIGNSEGPNRLYRNGGGALTPSAIWSSTESDDTASVAWGDYDGDGDLDLAVGNFRQPNRLYRNDGATLGTSATWSSTEADITWSLAWGDHDADGDLDLAAGNRGQPNRLYRNNGGTLTSSAIWSSAEADITTSIAWGDYDSDADLDLAVGNLGQPNRLYRNDGGILTASAVWSSVEADMTRSLAWGDYDGDGALDLAVGNIEQPNRLYRNNGATLGTSATWSSAEADATGSVAWGDYDGDGDLDLAVGNNGQPNRLYRNNGGSLGTSAAWSSVEADATSSVAWGDYDGDGDLDLAVGNYGQPNRLYRNESSGFMAGAVWSSAEFDATRSLAWGDFDGDGDLDLAVGNEGPNRLYRNEDGVLTVSAVWSSAESETTWSIAGGDYDGDGDLDLAAGNWGQPNRVYRNGRDARALPGAVPTVRAVRPGADADFYSAAAIRSGLIPITYVLAHPQSAPVKLIRAWYSLDGGGQWFPAVPASGVVTTNLSTSRAGVTYTFTWDVAASGFFGQSDNVVFRIEAFPAVTVVRSATPGPYLYGAYASQTFPFRVRGTQVRVLDGTGKAVPNALVYRLPAGQDRNAEPIGGAAAPFRTDLQGYLQGRGALAAGDRLVALAPVQTRNGYTLYHTSAAPTEAGLNLFTVSQSGVQTLTVSPGNKLILFDLDVALEWDARKDERYLAQLDFDLRRTAELLFDWTDGQAALGKVRVFHDAKRVPEAAGFQPWYDAHIRIYATNRLRPWAAQGGLVAAALTDPQHGDIVYEPGQVHMGAVWNRYGEAGGSLGEDWPRTLAHELGHYLFYLDDNYMGLDAAGVLVPIDACPGAMADPYRDDYGEFHPDAGWLSACAGTLSHLETGRSDWATLRTFYPELAMPAGFGSQPGPRSLPLAVTQIATIDPAAASTALDVPIFYLSDASGASTAAGNSARAFLLQGDRLTDLGRPTAGEVRARGVRPGDRLCVFEPELGRSACETVTPGDDLLRLVSTPDWQPEIRVSPVTSRTIDVRVNRVGANLTLGARLYPTEASAPTGIPLTADAAGYSGRLTLAEPALDGHVHIFDAFAVRLEAENGQLAGSMAASTAAEACGGRYISTPEHFSSTARADFTISVPAAGAYHLWGRAMGLSHEQNSFSVSVDGGASVAFHIPPLDGVADWTWVWTRFQDPLQLTQGQHSIRVIGRERNTRLDAIFLTDRPGFAPSDGAPCPDMPAAQARAGAGREAITDYAVGGNPGHVRSGGGHVRSGGAPAMSSDGQVIIFGRDLTFASGEFYVVQAATRLPDPPAWAKVIGQGYWLTASAQAPSLANASISFQYLGSQVPPGEESFMKIHFWNGVQWVRLGDTNLSTDYNIASTRTRGPGLYALMSSIEIPLYGPGWNLFAYPILGQRPPAEALASIAGYYRIVYGYDGSADRWEVYDPAAPAWVNDLQYLRFGRGYWLNATDDITLLLKGASGASVSASAFAPEGIGLPPATYYGRVVAGPDFAPAAGMPVRALIGGVVCGEGEVREVGGNLVYALRVLAEGAAGSPGNQPGCGVQGRPVAFQVGAYGNVGAAAWDNEQAHALPLTSAMSVQRVHLPVVMR